MSAINRNNALYYLGNYSLIACMGVAYAHAKKDPQKAETPVAMLTKLRSALKEGSEPEIRRAAALAAVAMKHAHTAFTELRDQGMTGDVVDPATGNRFSIDVLIEYAKEMGDFCNIEKASAQPDRRWIGVFILIGVFFG